MQLRLILLFCFFIIATFCSAQQYTFTGKVTDDFTGEPLIGAAVSTGDDGVITDIYGVFNLKSDQEFLDITVSYVGYKSLELSVASDQEITLEMTSSEYLLDAAVITGSKYDSPIIESVTSISLIKPDLLSDANIPSLDQALDKVPGLQIQDGQANIRGGSGYSYGAGSRVLILVDNISALQADAGRLNWNDIPVENISQVEVLKGAASVLYGSAALNGIINIRTGEAGSVPVTRLSTSYRAFGAPALEAAHWYKDELIPYEWNVSGLHKQKIGSLDLVVNGFYSRAEEVYQDAFNNRGRLSTKFKYRFSPNLTAELGATYNKTNNVSHLLWRNSSTGQYGYVNNSLSNNESQRFFVDPSVTYFDNKGNRHKVFARYFNVENTNTENRSNTSQFYSAEYQFLTKIKSIDANLTAGLVGSAVNSDSELFSDTLITARNLAAYAQMDKYIGEKLKVSLGLRSEFNLLQAPSQLGTTILPNEGREDEMKTIFRAGANYKISDYSAMRISFGQGYRYPTITEKFISTSVGAFTIFPNVDLQSETGWSAEIGYKQGVKVGGWRGFVDLAAFISRYEDMTEFTLAFQEGGFGFSSQNIGDTEIKGIELEFGGESDFFGIPIRIIGGYAFIDPKYQDFTPEIAATSTSTENILKYRTRHNAKIDIQASVKKFVFGLGYQYASEMVAIDNLFFEFNDFLELEGFLSQNSTAYHLLGGRLGVKFDHLSVTLHGNNLFNSQIMRRPARLEPPRNVSLRLDYSF